MSRQIVEAPRATPPRYGLIAVAPLIQNDPNLVWIDGWEFNREACAGGGRVALNCGGGTQEMVPGTDPDDLISGDPFVVWAERHCSTLGFAAGDYEPRARRNLASVVSFELANELWTGALRDEANVDPTVDDIDNLVLSDVTSDTVTNPVGGGVSPELALGLLVGGLADCSHGSVGMIHVTPQLLVALAAAYAVYRDGNIWLTPMGHVVVADAGYDGSGPGHVPAGATQWAYATSMISVRLGTVDIPAGFNDSVNKATNTVVVYAQQAVGFQWDECCALAAEVTLPVPAIGPPS